MNNLSKDDIHLQSRPAPQGRPGADAAEPDLSGRRLHARDHRRRDARDIDLFGPSVDVLDNAANKILAERPGAHKSTTKNAITVYQSPRLPVQFITRWLYDSAVKVAESFDFTVAQAVIWYSCCVEGEKDHWASWAAEGFYQDLAARRLVYTCPARNEDAGGASDARSKTQLFEGRRQNKAITKQQAQQ